MTVRSLKRLRKAIWIGQGELPFKGVVEGNIRRILRRLVQQERSSCRHRRGPETETAGNLSVASCKVLASILLTYM
ncbi:MAG: hypothetical protein MZU97_08735 [Bacillus subtilis]|nr:hypothetical protein [Bacillus subtilis]